MSSLYCEVKLISFVTGFVCKEVICYPVLNIGTFLFLNMTLRFDRSRGVTKFLRSSLLVCTEYILNYRKFKQN